MSHLHPGQVVEVEGVKFRVSAINNQGKVILTPIYVKEGMHEMMMRLQSAKVPAEPDRQG